MEETMGDPKSSDYRPQNMTFHRKMNRCETPFITANSESTQCSVLILYIRETEAQRS